MSMDDLLAPAERPWPSRTGFPAGTLTASP